MRAAEPLRLSDESTAEGPHLAPARSAADSEPQRSAPEPARPVQVFTDEALRRLRLRDEPPTAGEAELAGPWHVSRLPDGGFGVFRRGDEEAGAPPLGVFAGRHLALLVAAALPGVGREEMYRVHPEAGEGGGGYPLLRAGGVVGSLEVFLGDLTRPLEVLECVVRSPAALALVLEAAGPTALERAGRELGLRLVALADEEA